VVLHPQSVIHSLVDYADGSVLAAAGQPDMRTPRPRPGLAGAYRLGRAAAGSIRRRPAGFAAPDPPTLPLSGTRLSGVAPRRYRAGDLMPPTKSPCRRSRRTVALRPHRGVMRQRWPSVPLSRRRLATYLRCGCLCAGRCHGSSVKRAQRQENVMNRKKSFRHWKQHGRHRKNNTFWSD